MTTIKVFLEAGKKKTLNYRPGVAKGSARWRD